MDEKQWDKDIEVSNIEEEVKKSYLSYAMSVIIGRAIPDVRDGLKPVHRRVLYSMFRMGNTYTKPHKKSARIVGDVIGKYHPHGDQAVYDSITRMTQSFSMRYTLVDGQGNFGSIDGDPPAAMRYTEVRMSQIASELLQDLDKDTVDFNPNYDNTLVEPEVLPSKVPNLIINGSSGIAVGMATNIPPHNLSEIIDGVIYLIDNEEPKDSELLKIVKGPDFPTGAVAYRSQELLKAYKTGKGKVIMRAKSSIEEEIKESKRIIVNELPYNVNKAKLLKKIADLVKNKKIEGISGLRDESDREGLRIVIELKKNTVPQTLLNNLYKKTDLENSFGIILLAIVNGRPKQMSLFEMLRFFQYHRKEVVLRRSRYELRKAEKRAHILEGLKIALKNIDEAIAIIKASENFEDASKNLRKSFKLTEEQAKAILEMRLQRLTNLEKKKIEEEYRELIERIDYLKKVIKDPKKQYEIVKKELVEIKEKYGDDRKTEIIHGKAEDYSWEDFVKEEEYIIVYTDSGYIKRSPLSSYKKRNRATRGQRGINIREEDVVKDLFCVSSHDYLIVITNKGRAYWIRTIDIPKTTLVAKGKPLVNFIELDKEEKVASLIRVRDFEEEKSLFFITKKGIVKRTEMKAFSNPRSKGIIAAGLKKGDEIMDVFSVKEEEEVLLYTKKGKVLRFEVNDVRKMGRTAAGVIGIRLAKNDEVIGGRKYISDGYLFLVSEKGNGKKTKLSAFNSYSRGSKGVKGMNLSKKTGDVVDGEIVDDNSIVLVITENGRTLMTDTSKIRSMGRATQGVKLIRLRKGDKALCVEKVK